MTIYIPRAERDLDRFGAMLRAGEAFTYLRFSDGEMEILRNRYLEIDNGVTVFRGRTFGNQFPVYDRKRFDPEVHAPIRRDLLASAMKRARNYFKGVPTRHNRALVDREFMVRLNGGMSEYMTFSDLLMNCNYPKFREEIVPLFAKATHLAVIGNFRAKLNGELARAEHLTIGDNFFDAYEATLNRLIEQTSELPRGTLILSSASSMSNVIGMKLFDSRPDITFIDVGSAINDLLGLDSRTRAYHQVYAMDSDWTGLRAMRYKWSEEYKIRW